jgi:predicted DNA-binding transcriptional regulator YafY
MATQYNSIIRLKKIDECLRNRNKVYKLPELISAISQELESQDKKIKVSERTIYDDLKFLKDEYGPFKAPITRTNEKGYFYEESGYSIFNPMQDHDTIEKIKSSLSALRQVANMTGYEDLKDTVLRMEASYNFDEEQRIDPIVHLEEGLNIAAQKRIEPLKTHIQNEQVISVIYKPFDKAAYARVVSPYFLKEYNNRWFLFGHQHAINSGEYEGLTNISLDRITGISKSFRDYVPKGNLNIKEYLSNVIGVTVPKEDIQIIQFKVFGIRRHYVDTKKIHESQRTVEMNDKYGLFSISVIPNRELYSHLLGFGGDLEVLRPEGVRKEMKEKVDVLFSRY